MAGTVPEDKGKERAVPEQEQEVDHDFEYASKHGSLSNQTAHIIIVVLFRKSAKGMPMSVHSVKCGTST